MDYLQSILDAVIQYLTGPLGKSFFSLSLIGCGIGCGTGKLHWSWLIAAIIGAGIAFGGTYLVGIMVPS